MKGMPRSLARAPKSPGVRHLKIPIRGLVVAMTDVGASGAWGTAILGGLPEGNILLLAAVSYVRLTGGAGQSSTFVATTAVGTAPTADQTLAGAEVDVLAAAAMSAATASVSPVTRAATATAQMIDNTDGSKELNLNVTLVDAGSTANGNMTADGVIHIAYVVMGDD
jgi:hypothetical protein